MAERTTSVERLDRETAADRLVDVAGALRGDETRVQVGNKEVRLAPPDELDYHIEVVEKGRRFRGDRETIQIELGWKPDS